MVSSNDLLRATRARAHRHRHGHRHGGHGPIAFGRRRFLGLAGTGATLIAAGPLTTSAFGARPARPNPKPINGGVGPLHVYPVQYKTDGPPAVWDQSTITDFNGKFASTDTFGWGKDGRGHELWFRCDMRVMQGDYYATDGELHYGTFGFI